MNIVDLILTDPKQAKSDINATMQDRVFNYLDHYQLAEDALSENRGYRGTGSYGKSQSRDREDDEGYNSSSAPGEWEPVGKYKHPKTGEMTYKYRHSGTKQEKWLGDE